MIIFIQNHPNWFAFAPVVLAIIIAVSIILLYSWAYSRGYRYLLAVLVTKMKLTEEYYDLAIENIATSENAVTLSEELQNAHENVIPNIIYYMTEGEPKIRQISSLVLLVKERAKVLLQKKISEIKQTNNLNLQDFSQMHSLLELSGESWKYHPVDPDWLSKLVEVNQVIPLLKKWQSALLAFKSKDVEEYYYDLVEFYDLAKSILSVASNNCHTTTNVVCSIEELQSHVLTGNLDAIHNQLIEPISEKVKEFAPNHEFFKTSTEQESHNSQIAA